MAKLKRIFSPSRETYNDGLTDRHFKLDKSFVSRIKPRLTFRLDELYYPTNTTEPAPGPESRAATRPRVNEVRRTANEHKAKIDTLRIKVQQALQAEVDEIMPGKWSNSVSVLKKQLDQALEQYILAIFCLLVSLQEDRDSKRASHKWDAGAEEEYKSAIEETRRADEWAQELRRRERMAEGEHWQKIRRHEEELTKAPKRKNPPGRRAWHWSDNRYEPRPRY